MINKKRLLKNRTRDKGRVRLEEIIADLRKTTRDLKDKIRHKTDELKIKNGQLRNGAEKQVRSEEQIHIRTKAMESTTDGILFLMPKSQIIRLFMPINHSRRWLALRKERSLAEIISCCMGQMSNLCLLRK